MISDIDITSKLNQKYTLEVKTTEKFSISLSTENLQALRDRTCDGYQPIIAVLRISHFENWILAKIPMNEIQSGDILIDSLRTYRMKDLEGQLSPKFDDVVREHFKGVMKRGEQYLKQKLNRVGVMAED